MAENPNGNSLPDESKKAAHDAGEAAGNLVDRASDALQSAEDAVANAGDAVVDAGSKLVDGAGKVVDKASDTLGHMVDDAENAMSNAGKTIRDAGESAYDTGAKLVDSAGNAINNAEKAVSGAGSKLVDSAGKAVQNAAAIPAGVGIAAKKAETTAKNAGATAMNKTGHAIDETTIAAQRAARKAARDAKALSDRVADRADNIKWLVIALLVLLIAAAAIYSYVTKSSAKRSADAQNLVFKSALELQGKPEADAMAIFGKAAQEFKGLPAGQQARLYQFAYAFNTNKYADSEQAARDFLKDYPGSSMANRASLALGQAQMQQGKFDDAVSTFRALAAKNDPETLPEAKLALAQSLERLAENVKDQPAEYRRRLEQAEQEYSDIISRANISVPSQRGYWAQSITLPADYALVQIKDKLAGHEHGAPTSIEAETPVSQRDLEGAGVVTPPSASAENTQSLGISSDYDASTSAGSVLAAAAAMAGTKVEEGKEAVREAVESGVEAASDAANRAKDAVTGAVDKAKDLLEGKDASPAEGATKLGARQGADTEGTATGNQATEAVRDAVASSAADVDSLSDRARKAIDALRGYAVTASPTGSSNHISRVVNLVNNMTIDGQALVSVSSSAPTSTPDGIIDVQTDVDHGDEEYVKASEAGL